MGGNLVLKSSLHKRILFSILLISAFFFIFLGVLNYYLARNVIMELSENKATISANNASTQIESYLLQKAQYAFVISQDQQVRSFVKGLNTRYQDLSNDADYQQILTTFKRIVTQDPDITEAYIAIEKTGRIYDSMEFDNPPDYIVQTRPWYINALKNKTLTFTSPYICPVTGKYVITASIPFYDNEGTLLGVAAVDILADKVQNIVNGLRFGENGYAFMFDEKGVILFHPQDDFIQKSLLDQDYFSPDVTDFARDVISNEGGLNKFLLKDDHRYMFYSPIKGVNWSLAIIVPMEEITKPVYNMGKISFITILLAVIFIAFIITWWTSQFRKYVGYLVKLMSKVERGDYTLRAGTSNIEEIGLLGSSINTMLDKQEQILKRTKGISYKIEVAGHDLAMTIGAINTLIPIVLNEINYNFIKKNLSEGSLDKFGSSIKSMQALVEKNLILDHDTRFIITKIDYINEQIDKLTIKEDAESIKRFEEFKEQWHEITNFITNNFATSSEINTDYIVLLEDLNSIHAALLYEVVSVEEIYNKIDNINLIQKETIENAQGRSMELLSYSRALLELSTNYKTSEIE